jgi:hypothetical protein
MSTSVLESPQTPNTAIETMRAVVVHNFDAPQRVGSTHPQMRSAA